MKITYKIRAGSKCDSVDEILRKHKLYTRLLSLDSSSTSNFYEIDIGSNMNAVNDLTSCEDISEVYFHSTPSQDSGWRVITGCGDRVLGIKKWRFGYGKPEFVE